MERVPSTTTSHDPARIIKTRWRPLPSPRRRINRCGICGGRSPMLFDVPDAVWKHYVPAEQRWHVICIGCWDRLTDAVDGSAFEHAHGEPVLLWSRAWRDRHGVPYDEPSPFDGSRVSDGDEPCDAASIEAAQRA